MGKVKKFVSKKVEIKNPPLTTKRGPIKGQNFKDGIPQCPANTNERVFREMRSYSKGD